MRILVVARTAEEYRWALAQAARTRRKDLGWCVCQIGDIQVGTLPSEAVPEKVPPTCQVISVEDLDIDSEKVWRDVRELQRELWQATSTAPEKQLHLVSQWVVAVQLFRLAYLESAIAAALRYARPDEVRVPPASATQLRKFGTWIGDAQWLVCDVARQHGVRCKKHWSYVLKQNFAGPTAAASQIAMLTLLLAYDLKRIVKWLAARLGFPGTAGRRFGGTSATRLPAEAILLANVDSDLERQFNVNNFSEELSQRCVAWILNLGRLIAFTDNRWKSEILPLYLAGRKNEGDAIAGENFGDAEKLSTALFPTLVTPLILGLRDVWYSRALTLSKPPGVPLRLFQLLGSRGMANERLLNYRRIIYAAKQFALGSDLFRVARPALVVASDAKDVDRALALAARRCGVPSLATSHGLEMRAEQFFELYPMADVHCLFGHSSAVIGTVNLPGTPTERIVCHDTLTNGISPEERVAGEPKGRRVLIVTGGIINSDLFVRQSAFTSSLQTLIAQLAGLKPAVEISFKAHPLFDHYDLYESLQEQFPAVVKRVWREPLTADQIIPADVVVFFNYISTLFLTAVRHRLAIVGHWGALTPLGRRLIRVAELSGSSDSTELAQLIGELLSAPGGRRALETWEKTECVRDTFVEPPIGGFAEAVEFAREANSR